MKRSSVTESRSISRSHDFAAALSEIFSDYGKFSKESSLIKILARKIHVRKRSFATANLITSPKRNNKIPIQFFRASSLVPVLLPHLYVIHHIHRRANIWINGTFASLLRSCYYALRNFHTKPKVPALTDTSGAEITVAQTVQTKCNVRNSLTYAIRKSYRLARRFKAATMNPRETRVRDCKSRLYRLS